MTVLMASWAGLGRAQIFIYLSPNAQVPKNEIAFGHRSWKR